MVKKSKTWRRRVTRKKADSGSDSEPQSNKRDGLLTKYFSSTIAKDLVVIGIFGVVAYLVSAEYDAFEQLHEFSVMHEELEVDEAIVAALVLLVCMFVFSIRRVWEQRAEIVERRKVEQELIAHKTDLQHRVDEATHELMLRALESERALAREKELNELQRQFVAMASHELRTPLALIDSAAQRLSKMIRSKNLTEKDAFRRVDNIRSAISRMTGLIERTLLAASVEKGTIEIDVAPCDIGEILAEVCARQQELSPDHVITCDLTGIPETIQAAPNALDQIFTNIVSNAVKYARDAPDIQISGWLEGRDVVVSVRDQGFGIDDMDMPRIFDRFFRSSTVSGISGTGIGLNLVKALVELHNGSIAAESVKGKGSNFTVRLPISGPAGAQEKTRAAA